MTHQPPQSDASLPAGLTEADLLDWVERRAPLSPAIDRAIRSDPALLSRLEEMRVDRAAIAALEVSRAPADLLDGIERTLERQLLVGLSVGEPLSDGPPVSVVTPSRRSRLFIGGLRSEAVGQRLALAAGLGLLVGGLGLVATIAKNLKPVSPVGGPLADPRGPERGPVAPDVVPEMVAPGAAGVVPDGGMRIAANSNGEQAPEAMAGLTPGEPAPATLTLARAAELAAEGRLAVRIRSRNLDLSLERMAWLAGPMRQGWRLSEDAPPTVVAALQAADPRLVMPLAGSAPTGPSFAYFGGQPRMPFFDLPLMPLPRLEPARIVPTVFMAHLRGDEDSLRAMLAVLDSTTAHSASFEELPISAASEGPSLDAQAVLWWAQPPAGWRAWVAVPVVVEPAR